MSAPNIPPARSPSNPEASATTVIALENVEQGAEGHGLNPAGPRPTPQQPLGSQTLNNATQDEETALVLEDLGPPPPDGGKGLAGNEPSVADRKGLWGWLERRTGIQEPYLWLIFNGVISLMWGFALATFASGIVPWAWSLSQFAKRFDRDWTNETVALVGSICTLHVTYVLQLTLKEYSYIVLAREFTLKDLKCLQGVNEMTLFAEFPDRPGAPPRLEGARGPRAWWRSAYRFCNNKRLAWYVLYLGVALHTTSIVSILQPQIMIRHVTRFNDSIPCAVDPGQLSFGKDRYLEEDQQLVVDRLSYGIGIQLGNYADQVSGNTTTAISGRNYRKDNLAYGAVGGLIEGLQDIPGVLFSVNCTERHDENNRTEVWKMALPDAPSPEVFTTNFRETSTLSSNFQRAVSHPSLTFNSSLTESAMYAVVDTAGNGAFVIVSEGRTAGTQALLTCGWKTTPRIVHVQVVNFTSLALGHESSDKYPSLISRATLSTLQGMAQAARLGASINLDVLEYRRNALFYNATYGYSYDLTRNTTTTHIVETILADGGKASMTPYNVYLSRLSRSVGDQVEYCPSRNKTVSEHYRFGNNKHFGWISVIWTTGIGVLGIWTALWMSKKKRVRGESPLGAAGGFILARGENIDDYDRLVVRNGKVVNANAVEAS